MNDRKYTLATHGAHIESFLRPLLKQAKLRVHFEILEGEPPEDAFETPELLVKFTGDDVDLLLANRAELLLALEHVTLEMLRAPSEDHSRVSFDANDYRLLRIEELRMSAAAAAEKVKRTGTPFRFNPMNSRERRVIHLALRDDHDVRSESFGSGPSRQVIVYPSGMASLPPEPAPSLPHGRPGARGPRASARGNRS